MKANELRLDNYVLDGHDKLCRIYSIHHDYFTCWINNHIGTLDIKYSNPIPLTEEWLVKFKIHKDYIFDNKYNRDTDDYLLYIEGIASCNVVNWDKPIKYVHEAQNLYFALTGEELEIKQNVTENV